MSITTRGLLLQAIPYLGKKQILKIFTPEQGMLSLFAQVAIFSPFALAEWVFRNTHKEIHPLLDVTLLDPLLHLRASYEVLSAAGLIAQDLFRTQLPNKRAPALFDLASFYFKKLALSPSLLATSFRLKLLLHEGLLSDPDPAFTSLEWDCVHTLAFSRSLSTIQQVQSIPYVKINLLFEERLT